MTIDDETKANIITLFDDGRHRNEIARQLGVSGSVVTRVCSREGRHFDRSKEQLDIRAAEADMAELRKKVATKMLLVADDALNDLDAPHLVYNFGGRDNTYEEHLLDEAPLGARVEAMRAASMAVDRAARIVERTPDGTDEAFGLLDALGEGLRAAAASYRSQEVEEEPGS